MTISSITVVGAGALGCYFAARLAEAGHDVAVVDVDEARLAKIHADGIRVRDAQGERSVRVRALTAEQAAGPVDLVILFTKGMHSAEAIRSVAHLAAPAALALTLQNGLGNAEVIAQTFAEDRVLIGMTDVPADLNGPNEVTSKGASETALGGYRPSAVAAADAVAEALRRAGFRIDMTNNVHIRIWEKLAFNAALNAVSTITGRTNGAMNSEAGRRLLDATAQEVIHVAGAMGIRVDAARVLAQIAWALAEHADHRPSMLQDFAAGRKTEIESINGAIVRAGEGVGVPTPINAMLADLVRMMESPEPGFWTV